MPKNRIIPVFIPHAGCSNTCVFCNQRKIAGILDPPTPENIKKLVAESLEKNESCCEVAFYGGSFTAIPEHMQNAYLSAISEFLPKLSGIRLSTRPDAMDDATANRLKSFGVTMVELGTQSMDNRVLNLSRRGHSAEDTVAAAECVKRNGLKLVLQIMPGLPGDTPEGAVETAKAVAELEPDAVRVYPVVVVEGTELADMWRRGEYAPLTLDAAAEVCAEIAEIFENQGIPIIRMGLNPS
jgi:histone acetyltransferase (RNA polymerase elongator complex component)